MPFLVRIAFVTAAVASVASTPPVVQSPATPSAATVKYIPYAAARPVIEVLRPDLLPEPLRGLTSDAREAAWPGWLEDRDQAIRERLAQGDDDTVVNFLLYGAAFTGAPRRARRRWRSLPATTAACRS